MVELHYIMSPLEKDLYDYIEAHGYKAAVAALTRACLEHADSMSDMGLKERAVSACRVVELLKDVQGEIDE